MCEFSQHHLFPAFALADMFLIHTLRRKERERRKQEQTKKEKLHREPAVLTSTSSETSSSFSAVRPGWQNKETLIIKLTI